MIALVNIFRLGIQAQLHLAPGHRREFVLNKFQITGHQGKQVTGFQTRVFPHHIVTTVIQFTLFNRVTVTQQDRIGLLIGNEFDPEPAHHIGTIGEIGNAAKTLCLTLGTQHATGGIQTFQGRVLRRLDLDHALQSELCRHIGNCQAFRIGLIGAIRQRLAIDSQ